MLFTWQFYLSLMVIDVLLVIAYTRLFARGIILGEFLMLMLPPIVPLMQISYCAVMGTLLIVKLIGKRYNITYYNVRDFFGIKVYNKHDDF